MDKGAEVQRPHNDLKTAVPAEDPLPDVAITAQGTIPDTDGILLTWNYDDPPPGKLLHPDADPLEKIAQHPLKGRGRADLLAENACVTDQADRVESCIFY